MRFCQIIYHYITLHFSQGIPQQKNDNDCGVFVLEVRCMFTLRGASMFALIVAFMIFESLTRWRGRHIVPALSW